MTAPQGTIRIRQDNNTVTFQVEGWTTMRQSLSFRRCAEQCLARGATTLWVDLRLCSFMDSTFIGTLLGLKRAAHNLPQGAFALVSPSPECSQVLHQMGVEGVFPVVSGEEVASHSWTDLTCDADDVHAFQVNVVQAHQELAGVEGPCGKTFAPVARCLAQEMETNKAKKP